MTKLRSLPRQERVKVKKRKVKGNETVGKEKNTLVKRMAVSRPITNDEEYDNSFDEELESFEADKKADQELVGVAEGRKTLTDLLQLKTVVKQVAEWLALPMRERFAQEK